RIARHLGKESLGVAHLLLRVAGFCLLELAFELVGELASAGVAVEVLKERQVRLGEKRKAATAGMAVEIVGVGVPAKWLDGHDQKRGRSEQARREQTSDGMASGIADAEPGERRVARALRSEDRR